MRWLAAHAGARYVRAARSIEVFATDTRTAIGACIEVHGCLNRCILKAAGETGVRQSVPIAQKPGVLPAGKYWRIRVNMAAQLGCRAALEHA
ncbi:MAG TPA: hypothetical protein VGL72_15240 [Bryobacteraceae bacterium]